MRHPVGITVCLTPESDPGVCAAALLDMFLLALAQERSPLPETDRCDRKDL